MKSILKIEGNVLPNYFNRALLIIICKFQVVNRKLSCSTNKLFVKIKCNKEEFFQKCSIEDLKKFGENFKELLIEREINFEEANFDDLLHNAESDELYLSIDKFLPRKMNNFSPAFVLTFIGNQQASIYTLGSENKLVVSCPYHLSLEGNDLILDIESSDDDSNYQDNVRWLTFVLHKKFKKWIEDCNAEDEESREKFQTQTLIDGEIFNNLYAELKEKYGKRMEAIWTDESTDPKKFVYEDVSIACYLLCLWRQEKRERPQTFVDFGCGNGLLVYILNQEGHEGYGIDVRKRKIWEKYQPQVDLREQTWNPKDTFKDIDWIIGNHSDELSPWVPVVAAKCSYNCRYFLLPCCAFEFSGSKFSKRLKDKSLYASYIDYLVEISRDVCGFDTVKDRLRIPSTKRIAIIGTTRSYDVENFATQCQKIDEYVKSSSENKFIPRDKVELVRNCTKVDKNIQNRILKTIFDHLLLEKNYIDDKEWNLGGKMEIAEAAKLISADDLKKLKSEFGGLQTLFKNNRNFIEVHRGIVKIRRPQSLAEFTAQDHTKKAKFTPQKYLCYFHLNHPQGCCHSKNECTFKHE